MEGGRDEGGRKRRSHKKENYVYAFDNVDNIMDDPLIKTKRCNSQTS